VIEGSHEIEHWDVVDHEGYKSYDIKRGSGDASKIDAVDASLKKSRLPHPGALSPRTDSGRASGVGSDSKAGGVLKIAVPDFKQIADQYLSGRTDQHDGLCHGRTS
jgi:hypothetical protein